LFLGKIIKEITIPSFMAKTIVALLASSSYRSAVASALQGTPVVVNVHSVWKIQLKQTETESNLHSRWEVDF